VPTNSYQKLVVWQKAIEFVECVYGATRGWPKDEVYGLTNQIRRAAVSIPANIAEGQGRGGTREPLHFATIANGSLYEVETHLVIARRLQYLDTATYDTLSSQVSEVGRLLHGLMRGLRASSAAPDTRSANDDYPS
jgi:four helix bundle protein